MKVIHTQDFTFGELTVSEMVKTQDGRGTSGVAHFPPGSALPEKGTTQHDADEFSFIIKGHLRVQSGGEVHEVGPGDFLHIPKGEKHRSQTLGQDACELVWFLIE